MHESLFLDLLTNASLLYCNLSVLFDRNRIETLESCWRRMSAAKADKERLSAEWRARRALL